MYRCVLFDLDGTLVNSYEGIFHAYQWAFQKIGKHFDGEPFVQKAIGAPLPDVFRQMCGMTPEETARAVIHYRQYYAEQGKHQVQVYDGMRETLERLQQMGCFLGAATLKKEDFAKGILEEQGLLRYFATIRGMDALDQLTKADLIREGMRESGAQPQETVLVGDSEFDAAGAKEAGVDFLAVTYGFGVWHKETMAKWNVTYTADSAAEIIPQLSAAYKGKQTHEK